MVLLTIPWALIRKMYLLYLWSKILVYQHFNFLPKTYLINYSAWVPSMRQPNIDLSLEQWLSYHRLSKLLWQKNQIGFRMPVKSDLYSRKLDSLERKDWYLDGGSKIGLKRFFIYACRRYYSLTNFLENPKEGPFQLCQNNFSSLMLTKLKI